MFQRRRARSIAKSIGLGTSELNTPCKEYLFPSLANFVHPWREVFASLLTLIDIDDIDSENSGCSEQEKRIAALRKWKTRNGQGATYETLVKALLGTGKVDQAEAMCRQLLAIQAMKDPTQCSESDIHLTDLSPGPAIPPALPPFPMLTPPLSPLLSPVPEQYYPSCSVEEKIGRLDREYTEIEDLVLETIRFRNIPHKSMLSWVQVLPINIKPQFSEVLQRNAKALCNASSVDELFIIISPYWNSLHPTLLEHLVNKLNDDKLKARMKQYIDELCKFRIHTKLRDFIEKWAGGVPPGFEEFTVEVGEEWREKTVQDLEEFRIRLSRQHCIGDHMTYMKKVHNGSVLVVLAIPQCCFPIRFDDQLQIQKFFAEEHILGVHVGGKCILDLHQCEKPYNVEDETCESCEIMAVGESLTALSDYGTDSAPNSLIYLHDIDAEWEEQLQPSDDIDGVTTHESKFLSVSSISLRFISETEDGISIVSPPCYPTPRFRSNPLRRTGEFEIQIEVNSNKSDSLKQIEIGLERYKSYDRLLEEKSIRQSPENESSCTFVCGAVFNYLKRHTFINIRYSQGKFSLQGFNRIGMRITRGGDLEFFIDGRSLGIAAEEVYKLGQRTVYRPMVELPPGKVRATLTAGAAQTEVLSLQQMCIDCVAETLNYPEDTLFLPLPNNIKEKVAKVVFDPEVDFCYDPHHIDLFQRNPYFDRILNHDIHKELMSTVR